MTTTREEAILIKKITYYTVYVNTTIYHYSKEIAKLIVKLNGRVHEGHPFIGIEFSSYRKCKEFKNFLKQFKTNEKH